MSSRSCFRPSRRRFIFRARRWKLRVGAAAAHWTSPELNPFLALELRRSLRKRSRPFYVAGPLFLVALSLIALTLFYDSLQTLARGMASGQSVLPLQAQRVLGDSQIEFMASVAAGLCGYAALFYSNRALAFLQRALLSGSLVDLLLVPLPETRLALLLSAPSVLSTATLWLFLMPLWVLACATEQWTWREFVGLPALLLLIIIKPPVWQPVAENLGATALPPKVPTPTPRPVADDSEPVAAAEQGAAPQEEVDDEHDEQDEPWAKAPPNPLYQTVFNFEPNGFLWLLLVWQAALLWARFTGYQAPRGVLNYVLPHWREFLPQQIWNLVPLIPLTWPLFMLHLLIAPLPFFGAACPLALWWVPRLVLGRYAAFAVFRLSYLGGHSVQHWRWGRHYRAIRRAQGYLFWFFGAGFLWPWLVDNGAFAATLPGAPLTPSGARAGLWTVCLFVAAWISSGQLRNVLAKPFKKPGRHRFSTAMLSRWRRAWRRAMPFLMGPLLLYFGLCWLGGTTGVDDLWLSRLPVTLWVTLAFLMSNFGDVTMQNAFPKSYRPLWHWLHFLWFSGLMWEAIVRVLWAYYAGTSFDLADQPHLLLSPYILLVSLLNSNISLCVQGAFWVFSLGLCAITIAAALTFRAHPVVLAPAVVDVTDEGPAKLSFLARFMTSLWRIVWFVPGLALKVLFWPVKTLFLTLSYLSKSLWNAILPFVERQVVELWRWVDSFDNPILQRALRMRRQQKLAIAWLTTCVAQFVILLFILGLGICGSLSDLHRQGAQDVNLQTIWRMLNFSIWGHVVFGVAMAFGLFCNAGTFSLSTAFDKERANGGMVFLFLTPLTEAEIIGGHIGAALSIAFWYHTAVYPIFLLALLLEIATGNSALLPLLFLLMALPLALAIFSVTASMWSAVRAKAASEGNIWVIFIGWAPQALYLLVLGAILTATQSIGAMLIALLGLVCSLLGAAFLWRDALRRFHRERYGDLSIKGTIAN